MTDDQFRIGVSPDQYNSYLQSLRQGVGMSELELIKQAFKEYADKESMNWMPADWYEQGMQDAAALFWPFLELYFKVQADDRGLYADEIKALYKLKAQLGMPLKAHEVLNE